MRESNFILTHLSCVGFILVSVEVFVGVISDLDTLIPNFVRMKIQSLELNFIIYIGITTKPIYFIKLFSKTNSKANAS